MGIIKGIKKGYNTRNSAKRHWRPLKSQKYRDNLAETLKWLRTNWEEGKRLASDMLRHERTTSEYLISNLSEKRKWWNNLAKHINVDDLAYNIENFESLDQEIAIRLIKQWYSQLLINNFDKFDWLNYEDIVNEMIKKDGGCALILGNLDKFDWLVSIKKIVLLMVTHYRYFLVKNIKLFNKYPDYNDIVKIIVDNWPGYEGYNEFLFVHLGNIDNEILKYVIEAIYKTDAVVEYKRKELEAKKYIGHHILSFYWLLDIEVAKFLIRVKPYEIGRLYRYGHWRIHFWVWECVAKNIQKFKESDHKEIANMIIKSGGKDAVITMVANIDRFKWIDYKDIAIKLINAWYIENLMKYAYKFKWLDEDVAIMLIEKWYWDFVAKHTKIFWLKKEK